MTASVVDLVDYAPTSMGIQTQPTVESARKEGLDVVLVDDDAADSTLVMNVLRTSPRVGSARAFSAPLAALAELASGETAPALILLDIRMPMMNGFEFVRILRKIPHLQATPVAFLTTSRQPSDIHAARDTDVFRYVIKPETYGELQSRIDDLIDDVL